MNSNTTREIPSFEEVNTIMENFHHPDPEIRYSVFCWYSEFSINNYIRMKTCMLELYKIPAEQDIPSDSLLLLKDIGNQIWKEGGLTAQQACFYIMVNFMDIHRDGRLKRLQIAWNGCGEWRY